MLLKVESCVDTYRANHSEVEIIHRDIRKVTNEELKKLVGNREIHIGGF